MSMLNTDVLASLSQQRHAELVQEAEVARLLHKIEKSQAKGLPSTTSDENRRGRTGLLATILALPGRLKLA